MKRGLVLIVGLAFAAQAFGQEARWWKGNTHTHTWWSDGDTPPEVVSAWYKEHGYHFLVLSDHNVMLEGTKVHTVRNDAHRMAYKAYVDMFGEDWVEDEKDGDTTKVTLKTLNEFRSLFEEAGRFIFIKGEEITDGFESRPVHVNGVNMIGLIMPRGGASIAETIQNNFDAVREQSDKSGQPMFAHLNHPNFQWSNRIEDFVELRCEEGEGFMEIYNGHPGVRNYGDDLHPSAERMWDVVLSKRLGELNLSPIYGVATDDAHEYTAWGVGETNPGRGWIMVRAARLTPNTITNAVKAGDFYCSTGVSLRDVSMTGDELAVEVDTEPGVEYTIEFIGTRKDADLSGKPRKPEDPDAFLSLKYGDDIGKVLKTVKGDSASYRLDGNELYVRARITSTKLHPNPFKEGDYEQAWTQPLVAR